MRLSPRARSWSEWRVGRPARPSIVALGAALAFVSSARDAEAVQQCQPSSVVDGVDLNPAGDGTLPWAGSGKGFAIIKATQGTSYTDSDFGVNWAALKSAGVVRGAYHFFDATVSGVDQANYFLGVVGTIEPGDLPPTLDIECPVAGEADCLGNGNSGAAPASQITQAMNDFLTTVKQKTGLTPIVYSYGSWFADNGVDTTGLESYPLWLADYSGTSCFNVPTPWTAATIWQYDSSGSVGGINVDDDYFLGTAAQLATFTANGSTPFDAGVVDSGSPDYGPCTVTATGDTGICIDTTQCTSEGGTSTPDFCPGPANVQCCTGIPAHDAGTSSGGTGDGGGGGKGPDGGAASGDAGIHPGSDGGKGGSGSSGGSGLGAQAPDGGSGNNDWGNGSGHGCSFTPPEAGSWGAGLALGSMLALGTVTRRRRRR